MSAAASPVYRETFLRDRLTAERRETVRAYGAILEDLTSEATALLPDVTGRSGLAALAVDLHHEAALLEDLRDEDGTLRRRALRWADRLREVEAEMLAALGADGGAS